jgi:NADPH-dependent curcumin reductase CurA
MPGWMMAGTLKTRQDIRPGLENAAAAVNGLSTGGKLGKLLVEVTP